MLYCLDLDGTLIRSFMEPNGAMDYNDVELLPGRYDKLKDLAVNPTTRYAIVTNQGGVAFGYQTVDQVRNKLAITLAKFDLFWARPVSVHIAFEHPRATVERWRAGVSQRRKPFPGMINEAMRSHYHNDASLAPAYTVMVGDMDTDRLAAEAAHVKYIDSEEFFNGGR